MENNLMKNQHVDIEKMSDSEFLSWLYLERDREESIRNKPGWTIWALGAALISILYFIYSFLEENINNIELEKAIICSSAFLAVILYLSPFHSLLKVKRALDYKRFRELKDEAPFFYPFCVILVSITYSILIHKLDSDIIDKNDIILIFLWLLLAVLYGIGINNVSKYYHEIAPALGG